ncbi:MAG: thioredoxin domain-containing protein, partial [Desulfobacterales bacterium]|nr:thioredoxin domain-containing protein [Desulfobacterales bacterium]
IDELAAEYGGQIKITKCNVDENSATPGKYGIKAIPTLLFFKGGDLVDQLRGLVAKNKIDESLKKLL